MQRLQVAANILCFRSNKGHAGHPSEGDGPELQGISHVTELWLTNMQLSVRAGETLEKAFRCSWWGGARVGPGRGQGWASAAPGGTSLIPPPPHPPCLICEDREGKREIKMYLDGGCLRWRGWMCFKVNVWQFRRNTVFLSSRR